MRRLAFLACATTLPGSASRRDDAHEHDQEVDALGGPLAERRIELVEVDWDGEVDWSSFDAVLVRTTWNYQDRKDEFLSTLRTIERAGVPVWNPPDLIEWNITKTYLQDLAARGVPTVETVWIDHPTAAAVDDARSHLGDDVVVKRQVGAGAQGQVRHRSGEPSATHDAPVMVQPFLPAIQSEGEWSFVFVDGDLSHALVKRARSGDYRIQSSYGGVESPAVPADADLAAATEVIDALDEAPLYGRVDMVRHGDRLVLMELELIEPFLYPLQGPGLGERLAAAIDRRL